MSDTVAPVLLERGANSSITAGQRVCSSCSDERVGGTCLSCSALHLLFCHLLVYFRQQLGELICKGAQQLPPKRQVEVVCHNCNRYHVQSRAGMSVGQGRCNTRPGLVNTIAVNFGHSHTTPRKILLCWSLSAYSDPCLHVPSTYIFDNTCTCTLSGGPMRTLTVVNEGLEVRCGC